MPLPTDPLATGSGTCPICESQCKGFEVYEHRASYPFLKGGHDEMAFEDFVFAPHRVIDEQLEKVVYASGDRVPLADAIKYGLIPDPKARARTEPSETAARKPAANRAHKQGDRR